MGEEKDLQQEEISKLDTPMEETKEETASSPASSPAFDYNAADKATLVKRLTNLVDSVTPLGKKSEIETLKSVFYLKLSKEHAEAKAAFLANEGKEEDFTAPKDELESVLKSELSRYRKIKNEIYEKQEKEREENLKMKEGLIEELKELVEKEESLKDTFEIFHSIQERWHTIGAVPSSKNNDLWQTYHLHVEHFYDYIKINKDLRDLDFKRNLEKKESLCEKAEKLAEVASPIDAFRTLQVYHQQWKETGPVNKELRESLWERFKAATSVINKSHQNFFSERKAKELENLTQKEALCEQAEALSQTENASAKEWSENVKKIQELQDDWRKIGHAPKKDNNSIYRRFRKACDVFFKNKREFYKQHKDELNVNFEKKKALLEKAIALKDNEDWKATTEELISLQKEWKTIGAIPRKYSEKIWNQFREACDIFFERKKGFYGGNDAQQGDNLKLKEALIEKIKAFSPSESPQEDIKTLLAFKEEWMTIGHVPIKQKNKINSEYHNELNAQFDKLNLKKEDREMEKFRSKLDDINDNSGDKVYSERKKLSLRLKDLESEIGTLENNIGFLSKSKSTEGLVKEYTQRIDKAKNQKILLKKKIRMIDAMD